VNIEKIFGEELQKIRKEKGLSQEQLGFESGYHRTYISQLERGIKSPSLKTIFRISEALKIQPSKFIQRIETNAQ
jgi:transcriptional regulator with XRE-family HTH domain